MVKFQQVDVFSAEAFKGNPVAVVAGADDLSTDAMQQIANWTNLTETTFLLKPTEAGADYRVRIFTPVHELPFAGHPTLGSCHAWLRTGGKPQGEDVIQQCEAGLIRIRRGKGLAFAAPSLLHDGAVSSDDLAKIATGLHVSLDAIVRSQWIDNGPGWVAVMLESRDDLLAIEPDYPALGTLELGVIAPWEDGTDAQYEVRAFMPSLASEDPVTGSLNAGLAQWLIGSGVAPPSYTASQGTAMGRRGRVTIEQSGDDIWVGGATVTRVEGTLLI